MYIQKILKKRKWIFESGNLPHVRKYFLLRTLLDIRNTVSLKCCKGGQSKTDKRANLVVTLTLTLLLFVV